AKVDIRVTMPDDVKEQLKPVKPVVYEKKTEEQEDLFGVDETHPSYGSIHLGRVSGSAKLFMSPFRHNGFISISISRAKRVRNLANDRLHGELRKLVEVLMSEAQFAHFITSMFDGSGTPCTIHQVTGTTMPEPPEGGEVEKFHKDVKSAQV